MTPAHYFNKFRAITPQFTELTGIKIDFEVIPPREMREKAVLDLGAQTAIYASHTADPMYLPLYEANKWVDALDDYLDDPTLTDRAWFELDACSPSSDRERDPNSPAQASRKCNRCGSYPCLFTRDPSTERCGGKRPQGDP